jgi:hypothetical protein
MSHLIVYLMFLPIVWLIGWTMAMNWLKLRLMVQLNQLKEQALSARELVEDLQKLLQSHHPKE